VQEKISRELRNRGKDVKREISKGKICVWREKEKREDRERKKKKKKKEIKRKGKKDMKRDDVKIK
jgi:hypothetical protein